MPLLADNVNDSGRGADWGWPDSELVVVPLPVVLEDEFAAAAAAAACAAAFGSGGLVGR